tara:strand:- start:67 stop:453 length:387 start_codon:yes stop_codon:yes gene_type:complete
MAHKGENNDMSHYSNSGQTRRKSNGLTGVKGRKSREGGGLGQAVSDHWNSNEKIGREFANSAVKLWNANQKEGSKIAKQVVSKLKKDWFGTTLLTSNNKPQSDKDLLKIRSDGTTQESWDWKKQNPRL